MHSEQQGIDLLEKEALFQYLRQKSEGEMALSSDLSDIIKLRALPEVTAALEELKAAVSEEKSSQARRLSRAPVKSARRWADIPIAHVPADLKDKYPELGGTHEEFQQARQQLRTVRLASDDLGQEACLFNLRTMAIFLEYVMPVSHRWTD